MGLFWRQGGCLDWRWLGWTLVLEDALGRNIQRSLDRDRYPCTRRSEGMYDAFLVQRINETYFGRLPLRQRGGDAFGRGRHEESCYDQGLEVEDR